MMPFCDDCEYTADDGSCTFGPGCYLDDCAYDDYVNDGAARIMAGDI